MKYIYRETERDLVDDETGEILGTEKLREGYTEAAAAMAKAAKIKHPMFKTPWNHNTDAESLANGTAFPEIGKAQQSQKDEADINYIVSRFLRTGELPQMKNPPQYADLAEIDFQEAMDQVNLAQRAFDALPAKVRNAFQNDPARFLAYVDHCLETGDLKPLEQYDLAQIKVEEPAFEDRLAAAITKATKPATPPGGSPAPEAGKGAPTPL